MHSLQIQILSKQLCQLLGADSSSANTDKVADTVSDLLTEICNENSQSQIKSFSMIASNDPMLGKHYSQEIDSDRNMLIANLSALR